MERREKENHFHQSPGARVPPSFSTPPRGHVSKPRPFTAPSASNRRPMFEDSLAGHTSSSSRALWADDAGLAADEDGDSESNIRVFLRTRPASSIGGASRSCAVVDHAASKITLNPIKPTLTGSKAMPTKDDEFQFDGGVLHSDVSQDQLFDAIGRPAAASVLEGFNVSIFAYGQTGSGKTYTMYGNECTQMYADDEDLDGLTGRMLTHLFEVTRVEASVTRSVAYKFELSVLDVYDERVSDLFTPGVEKKVREGPGGVHVEGATWHVVSSVDHVRKLLKKALANRHVGETKMNLRSSRSHTICTVRVSRDEHMGGRATRRSATYSMVDLCGSERVKKSDVHGERLKEAIQINSSLSALKSVINALGDGSSHVPYRSSKLTWLLKDSLGGNSKVYIVGHINPDGDHRFESLSTLRFVSFAKSVRVKSRRNDVRLKTREEMEEEERYADGTLTETSEECITPREDLKRAIQVKDASTQVSPRRAEDICACGITTELAKLKEMFDQGLIETLEYREHKARLLNRWLHVEAPDHHHPPAREEEGGMSVKRRRVAPLGEPSVMGVKIAVRGPEENLEVNLCARLTATIDTIRKAVLASWGLPLSSDLQLWQDSVHLGEDTPISSLDLVDGDVLLARWGPGMSL